MKTYSVAEVAEMFGSESDWWIREGVRQCRFPSLRVGRTNRFTDEHVAAIAAAIEKPAVVKKESGPKADVSVFGATARSAKHHRNRAS